MYELIRRWVNENQGIVDVLGHPLVSFLPQITVVGFAGLTLPRRVGIEGTMFFQTALFVVFNKVVTSQVSPSSQLPAPSPDPSLGNLSIRLVLPIHLAHYTVPTTSCHSILSSIASQVGELRAPRDWYQLRESRGSESSVYTEWSVSKS